MEGIFNVDWVKLFSITTPLLEIFIRGTAMYLGLFLLLRFILKREAGTIGITDLLIVVLLADAAQNGLAGEYHSITEGLFLVLTLIFWAYALNWLGYRFPVVQRLIHPPALLLVKDGQMIRRNMRKEFITEDELASMLREQGVDELRAVKRAYMEGDGRISVITRNHEQHRQPESRVK